MVILTLNAISLTRAGVAIDRPSGNGHFDTNGHLTPGWIPGVVHRATCRHSVAVQLPFRLPLSWYGTRPYRPREPPGLMLAASRGWPRTRGVGFSVRWGRRPVWRVGATGTWTSSGRAPTATSGRRPSPAESQPGPLEVSRSPGPCRRRWSRSCRTGPW